MPIGSNRLQRVETNENPFLLAKKYSENRELREYAIGWCVLKRVSKEQTAADPRLTAVAWAIRQSTRQARVKSPGLAVNLSVMRYPHSAV